MKWVLLILKWICNILEFLGFVKISLYWSREYSIVNSDELITVAFHSTSLQLLNYFQNDLTMFLLSSFVQVINKSLKWRPIVLPRKNNKNVGKEYPFRPWIPTWMKFLVNKLLALMYCVSSHWRLPPSFIIVLFLVIYIAPSRSWTYNHILHPFLWEKKCRLSQNSLAVPIPLL